jgi:hypothetical protein
MPPYTRRSGQGAIGCTWPSNGIAVSRARRRSIGAGGWRYEIVLREIDHAQSLAGWQPRLRLHLFMRDPLAVPWGKDWPIVKRELARCAESRRAMIQAGWFN